MNCKAIRHITVLAFLAVAFTIGEATGTPERPDRTCFSKAQWSADNGDRPCVEVKRLYEDGSGVLLLSPADGSTYKRIAFSNDD